MLPIMKSTQTVRLTKGTLAKLIMKSDLNKSNLICTLVEISDFLQALRGNSSDVLDEIVKELDSIEEANSQREAMARLLGGDLVQQKQHGACTGHADANYRDEAQ